MRASPRRVGLVLIALVAVAGCGGSPRAEDRPMPDANDPAYAASLDEPIDPRISASAGDPDGVLVLWPRVVPAEGADGVSAQAEAMQRALERIAARVLPDRRVEVRPSPERACPAAGCEAVSLGAVLLHSGGGGCAAAAFVSRPGRSPAHLIEWAGGASVRTTTVPFREPPESHLRVSDFGSCETLAAELDDDAGAIEQALREAAGS